MGNPFVHIELVSTDVDKAKSFYGKLFNGSLDVDMGDMIYTLVKVGDGTGGGLMQNPMPDGHSMWIAYVKVGNVKKATSKAKALGAKVKKDVTRSKAPVRSASSRTQPARCSASGSQRKGSRRERRRIDPEADDTCSLDHGGVDSRGRRGERKGRGEAGVAGGVGLGTHRRPEWPFRSSSQHIGTPQAPLSPSGWNRAPLANVC